MSVYHMGECDILGQKNQETSCIIRTIHLMLGTFPPKWNYKPPRGRGGGSHLVQYRRLRRMDIHTMGMGGIQSPS